MTMTDTETRPAMTDPDVPTVGLPNSDERGFPWVKAGVWLTVIVLIGLSIWQFGGGVRDWWQVVQHGERIEKCTVVPEAVSSSLTATLREPGAYKIENWRASRSEELGLVFVTAEFIHEDLAEGAEGDLATWAAPALQPDAAFVSVDEHAAELSTIPAGEVTVAEESAVDSRFCVFKARKEVWQDPATLGS